MKHKRNVEGLKKYQKLKNLETIKKVEETIEMLIQSKTKNINFKTVAEKAEVSKATLYNNPILKERIIGLRQLSRSVVESDISQVSNNNGKKKDEKIKELYEQIRQLKQEREALVIQLIDMEEMKEENRRNREQILKLKNL